MKYLLIVSTLFFSLLTFAQQDSLQSQHRWQIGLNYSQDYCYRILFENEPNEVSADIIEFRNKYEKPKFGYTAGVNGVFNLNSRWAIGLGVHYSDKGYQMDYNDLIFYGSNGDTIKKITVNDHYRYLDVPLTLHASFGKRKLRFTTSIGMAANVFIQETVESKLVFTDHEEESRTQTDYDYSKVTLTPLISAGVSYAITDRWMLKLEPTFRFGATKIIDTPISARFYSAGANFGCYFSL